MSYYPISDADSSTKGLIQLAGDISGSAGSPTIPALADKADAAAVYTKSEIDSTLANKADTTALSGYVATAQKGAINGVATLDATGKVPLAQLQLSFPVTSVASRTGDVVLTKSDVGLDNVDNTSDTNKPVSSATQTALDGKANAVHAHAISDVTNLQTGLDGKAPVSHTHTASQISDSSAVGRSIITAADALTAQSALGITSTTVVVNAFADVTTPSYGTLYVVRA